MPFSQGTVRAPRQFSSGASFLLMPARTLLPPAMLGLLSLLAQPALGEDESKAMDRAWQVIRQSRLLPERELPCMFLMVSNRVGSLVTVDVREKHEGNCPGDRET